MNCDVLVVGASPAGIMAATSAAEKGSGVILLDRNMGSFNHPANTFFDGMLHRAGLEANKEYVLHNLDGMHIISPRGYSLEIAAPGYFIDRAKFDELYLKKAEHQGVELLKCEALGTDLLDNKRKVKTDQGSIDAKVVIDAGGAESKLATQAGLSPLRHPEDVAWAMEAVIESPDIGEEKFFEYWVGSMAPGWKATFSPGGEDKATLGVFVRRQGRNLKPFLDGFVERFKNYKNINNLKIISVNRGGDPIATLPGEIVSNSLMVTGSACGQSGMVYSMHAGSICGAIAALAVNSGDVSKKTLSRYEQQWKKEFYWEYRLGRASLETLRQMSDEEIDLLIKGLMKKNLDFKGSLAKKSISAGLALVALHPGIVPALARSFIEG
ncbi:MAG: geranylgeranyl reductase family protein [Methanotrichaceae archaeon]